MSEGIKSLLRKRLRQQKMFTMIDLLDNNAGKQELLELLEKTIVEKNPRTQKMMSHPRLHNKNSDISANMNKKKFFYRDAKYRPIYMLIEVLYKESNRIPQEEQGWT
ncbi:hypothetical protein [Aneurinibacillus migulanus]|uniref:Uncharacterized protein n=1 Tax=Aneurinibacillus migulanus TaxID=47500 RepID=A0A0D1WGT2_ANEMI|nr:hypothetical protein [Aneurinibacillus migulanus]KIV57770.1 hypothetical protein TS65_08985 [Aneurinibacillus migulanus]KON97134.1 hypothetical protein AF333_18360 [Aneurinibacillus migulanus]MCP1358899.1 hypothetical protein [Aneurinibacillus migulanus]MED0896434.1 hypothetical protein [Aneurinibacillus migulanus]MED1616093.1 hypothetical protein [Aneurinibacillus migulanus]